MFMLLFYKVSQLNEPISNRIDGATIDRLKQQYAIEMLFRLL
jgi:hypothetical protein